MTGQGLSRLRRAVAAGMLIGALVCAWPAAARGQEKFELKGGQWLKQKSYPPNSPRGQLQTIRKKLAGNDGETAESLAKKWLKDHPAGTVSDDLQAEAMLLVGDAKVAQDEYYDALYNYEDLIRRYPQSTAYHAALHREYEIARLFVHGMKRIFLGMRILPATGEGAELLIRVQERAPGSNIGERASMTLANYYYRDDQMANAAEAYDLFLKNYPQSPKREWAMLQMIRASLARFQGPGFDPTGLLDAHQRLKTFKKEFPAAADRLGADALLVRIQESRAINDLQTANWYRDRGESVSAAFLYRRLVKKYPQTAAAKKAIAQLKQMHDAVVVATPVGGSTSTKEQP